MCIDQLFLELFNHDINVFCLQKIYSSDKHISGLAVDWVWNTVYWTSREKGLIKQMDLNGKNEKTVLRHLTHPSCINVEPTDRYR